MQISRVLIDESEIQFKKKGVSHELSVSTAAEVQPAVPK